MSNLFHMPSLKGLTIYDVTYLYYALRNKLILVIGDGKLVEKSKATPRNSVNGGVSAKIDDAVWIPPSLLMGPSRCGFESGSRDPVRDF